MNNDFLDCMNEDFVRMILRHKRGIATAKENRLVLAWANESEERRLWFEGLTIEKLFAGAFFMSKIDKKAAYEKVQAKLKEP
jgi:hypothetical protein